MKAHDMLRLGERIPAIYTTRYGFELQPDHTGSTKAWNVDPKHALQADRLIIYYRDEAAGTNHLYIASKCGTRTLMR